MAATASVPKKKKKKSPKQDRKPAPAGLDRLLVANALSWGLMYDEEGLAADGLEQAIVEGDLVGAAVAGAALLQREDGDTTPTPTDAFCLGALAVAYSLTSDERSASEGPASLAELRRLADEAAGAKVAVNPLVHQLLGGELPLVLAEVSPEEADEFRATASAALSHGLLELTDGEGVLAARHWDHASILVASWARCRLLAETAGEGPWNADAEEQFQFAILQLIRQLRGDGSLALRPGRGAERSFLQALAEAACDEDFSAAAGRRRLLRGAPDDVPAVDAAMHSEWAAGSILAADWGQSDPRLVAVHCSPHCRLELSAGRRTLLTGDAVMRVTVGGKELKPREEWDVVCWVDDDEVSYLELEVELAKGVSVQRHLLAPKEDRFLFFADCLLGEKEAEWTYDLRWPLAPGVLSMAEEETHELHLVAKGRRFLAAPLSTPEWKGAGGDAFNVDDDALHYRRTGKGPRFAAALWINLDANRDGKPYTWRRLSVAEDRRNVPPSEAVGYRVQFGKRQWLFYRSLAEPTNRTVLGMNTIQDFCAARFDRDGEVEALVEIE